MTGVQTCALPIFTGTEFTVTYNAAQFDITDLCAFTQIKETTTGAIAGTAVNITQVSSGTIKFTINKTVDAGKTWSGVLNSIVFKSKISGQAEISFRIN